MVTVLIVQLVAIKNARRRSRPAEGDREPLYRWLFRSFRPVARPSLSSNVQSTCIDQRRQSVMQDALGILLQPRCPTGEASKRLEERVEL